MKYINRKSYLHFFSTMLLFGSLWGLSEATLGYLLHSFPIPGFSGVILFPIGFLLMEEAYRRVKSVSVIFFMGCIAAGIKFIDLLLPIRSVFSVINPVIAIVAESIVVGLVFYAVAAQGKKFKYFEILIACFGWRFLFLGVLISMSVSYGYPIGILKKGTEGILIFLLFGGILSSVLLWGMLVLRKYFSFFSFWKECGIIPASIVFAGALGMEYIL